jgi:tRNA pseudouridine38-40 synthase
MTRRNLRLTIEYDGTAYSGWQVQDNAPSIQGTLEEAIRRMANDPTARLRAAGRTDAGVHARGQVANFYTEANIPAVGWRKGLNSLLPPDIAVRDAVEVGPEFDARRHARGKLYRYTIYNHETRSPLCARQAWHVRTRLDEAAMSLAAEPLVGQHDFRAFRAADCERLSTVRDLSRLSVQRDGDFVTIEVVATAFLKNMVRIIAGTLVAAGHHTLGPSDVAAIRDGGDRTRAGVTAPPHGLSLVEVYY